MVEGKHRYYRGSATLNGESIDNEHKWRDVAQLLQRLLNLIEGCFAVDIRKRCEVQINSREN